MQTQFVFVMLFRDEAVTIHTSPVSPIARMAGQHHAGQT